MITAVLVLARTLHIGSALLIVSLLYFQQFILKPEADTALLRLIFRWLIGVWVIQIVSGIIWFWIVTAQMSDDPLLGVLAFGLIKTVFEQTKFGQIWLWRMAMAILLGVILIVAWRSNAPWRGKPSWQWFAFGLSGLLLISLAGAGHAASGTNYRALHIGVDILHLAIAAIWPAGLVPLAIFLCTLPKICQSSELEDIILILTRFSHTSLVAVMLLFLTGLANSCLLIPSLSALFASTYGQFLIGKIVLFFVMVDLGAMARLRCLPKLKAFGTPAALVRFQKVVLIENMLSLLVLFIVGAMGVTSPPVPAN